MSAPERPPDGWVHTPLPRGRREDGPDGRDGSWFARTGAPAPRRDEAPAPDEEAPPGLRLAHVVLASGILFLVGAVAISLWAL